MRHLALAFAAFATLSIHHLALADTYSFNISTDPSSMGSPAASFNASGTLTGTPLTLKPPTITLTGVTGSAQGYTFTGIVPLGTPTTFNYDNLLYTDPSAIHVDASGVLLFMSSAAGISLAHVYDNGGYHVDVFDPKDPGDVTPFAIQTFTIATFSAVPEPSTLALLGTGALTLLGAARRWARA